MTKKTTKAAEKKPIKNGECCEAMELALDRVRGSDRIGLQRVQFVGGNGEGKFFSRVVIRFAKYQPSKNELGPKEAYRNTTYAIVSFCPFCGHNYYPEEKTDVRDDSRSDHVPN